MNVPLWKTVDRFALRSEVLNACNQPEPSVVVVRGAEDCGLITAADLACAVLEAVGVNVWRVRPTPGRVTLVRDLLASAWRSVDAPAALGSVRRSVSEAQHLSINDLVMEVATCCASSSVQNAFVFDIVDPDGPCSRTHMAAFVDLARQSGATVLVYSRLESGSAVPRTATVVDLGGIELWEVSNDINTSGSFAGYDLAARQHLLAELLALSHDGTTVCAEDAYAVIEDALWRWDNP